MAQKSVVNNAVSGSMETLTVMLLSELIIEVLKDALSAEEIKEVTDLLGENDPLCIAIPDTGNAKFVGSHEIKTGKSAGKMSKATFLVGEIGSSFAGEGFGYSQGAGDHAGLELIIKASVIAQPPNTAGVTVDEALNRTPAPIELVKTGTAN